MDNEIIEDFFQGLAAAAKEEWNKKVVEDLLKELEE